MDELIDNHAYQKAHVAAVERWGNDTWHQLFSNAQRKQAIAYELVTVLALQDESIPDARVRALLNNAHRRLEYAWS